MEAHKYDVKVAQTEWNTWAYIHKDGQVSKTKVKPISVRPDK